MTFRLFKVPVTLCWMCESHTTNNADMIKVLNPGIIVSSPF